MGPSAPQRLSLKNLMIVFADYAKTVFARL